jgi:hypothetical protein
MKKYVKKSQTILATCASRAKVNLDVIKACSNV